MDIILLLYTPQALVSLLMTLRESSCNIDKTIQGIRGVFEMSTKALDQCGRVEAFNMIYRKAAASDNGLTDPKGFQSKVLYLPL